MAEQLFPEARGHGAAFSQGEPASVTRVWLHGNTVGFQLPEAIRSAVRWGR